MPDQPHTERPRRRWWTAPLVLFALTAAVYAPSVRYGFIYDDHELIVEPPPPRSAGDVFRVFAERHWYNLPYYRPVARLTMVGQQALHGGDAAPYHAFNVAAMGAAAVLAWLLYRLPVLGIHAVPAFFGAALFALHPIASCTVYPICSGRETLLPGLFGIGAVYAYLRADTLAWRTAAMVLFGLALFSKEQAIVVPVLLVLADALGLTPGPRPRPLLAWLRRYVPVLAIIAVYAVIRWRLFEATDEHRLAILKDPAGPALSLVYFLQTALAPFVELVYEPTLAVWLDPVRLGVVLLVLVLLGAWLWACWPAVGRTAWFWLGWTVVTLVPTANILVQQTPFAERWGWLSLAGLLGLVATLASHAWRRGRGRRPVVLGAGLALVAACAAVSVLRGPHFRNDIAFHTQWVTTNPASDQGHRSLGWALLNAGRLAEAEQHLRRAIRLNPQMAEAWNNLGTVLTRQGRTGEALGLYARALALDARLAEAHNNLATLLAQGGDLASAEDHYYQALRLRPDYSESHNGLGVVLARQQRFREARTQFERALRIDPDNAEAHDNLGSLLVTIGEPDQAADHFEHALRLRPDHAAAREGLRRLREQTNRRR